MIKTPGYKIFCRCCNKWRQYEITSEELIDRQLILTCWFCNDYYIHIGDGIKHSFRYEDDEKLNENKEPLYRLTMIDEEG